MKKPIHFSKVLKPGVTPADMLDSIEAITISYMQDRRQIDEAAMRALLLSDADVRASYERKCARAIDANITRGVHPAAFGRAA